MVAKGPSRYRLRFAGVVMKSSERQSIYRVLLVLESNDEAKLTPYLEYLGGVYKESRAQFANIGLRPMCVSDCYDHDIVEAWLQQEHSEGELDEIDEGHTPITIVIEDFEPVRLN